jgi:hypothetical protein
VVALYAYIYIYTHTHCHSMIVFLIVYCGFLNTTARTELDSHVVTVCVCVCVCTSILYVYSVVIIDGRKATQGYDSAG